MATRKFTAPPLSLRCECDRGPLSDGSGAQCMKRKAAGSRYCSQHHEIVYGWKMGDQAKSEMAAGLAMTKRTSNT